MEQLQEHARDMLPDRNLEQVILPSPQVLDERPDALRPVLKEPIGLGTRQLTNRILVLVPDVVAEATLVRGVIGLLDAPFGAVGELATVIGACGPVVHHVEGNLVALGDDEARVIVEPALLVVVVLQIRVLGQRNQIFLLVDAPVVEQPLKREVEVMKDRIRVDVDARRVLLEDTAEDGGFLP